MNNTALYSSLSFIVGATIGGFIVWKCTQKHYSDIAQNEIDSVKEKFTVPRKEIEKKSREEKSEEVSKTALNKPNIVEYAKKIKDAGYVNYSNSDGDKKKEEKKSGRYPWNKSEDEKNKPYVISPDDFADGVDNDNDYEQISLTFYSDGILADDDEIINADEVVGDALEHIGDYEDDAVHVCNPKLKVFYEILVDERKYEEATGKKPHQDDGEED